MIVFDVLVYVLALIGFLVALKWAVLFMVAGGQTSASFVFPPLFWELYR